MRSGLDALEGRDGQYFGRLHTDAGLLLRWRPPGRPSLRCGKLTLLAQLRVEELELWRDLLVSLADDSEGLLALLLVEEVLRQRAREEGGEKGRHSLQAHQDVAHHLLLALGGRGRVEHDAREQREEYLQLADL